MQKISQVCLVALTIARAIGQSPPERLTFEVASVKMYLPGSPAPAGGGGFKSSANSITANYNTLRALLEWAFRVPQVAGPDWIDGRYDVVANVANAVPGDQLKLMLQTLLENRFKLELHHETREFRVAALVVAKNGPKNLHPSDTNDPPEVRRSEGALVVRNAPMSLVAAYLGGGIPPYGVGQRVLDDTGIKGVFDLHLTVKDFDVKDPTFAGSYEEMKSAMFAFLSTALEKQYGLRLEYKSVPLKTLVIDGGNKVPTENE